LIDAERVFFTQHCQSVIGFILLGRFMANILVNSHPIVKRVDVFENTPSSLFEATKRFLQQYIWSS